MRYIIFAIYLGIGALLHAMYVSPQFDWSSAWTFGYLFGWPILLVIWFGKIILWVFAASMVFAIGVVAWESTWMWRTRRAMKKYAASFRRPNP